MRCFLITLMFSLMLTPTIMAAETKIIIKKPPQAHCNMLMKSLKATVERGNHCNTDDDCAVLNLGCPLPCNALVNASEDIRYWVVQKQNHDTLCGACEYKCRETSSQPVCEDGRCALR